MDSGNKKSQIYLKLCDTAELKKPQNVAGREDNSVLH